MKIHFITYGTSYPFNFEYALQRIKKEAINSKFFNTINIYRPEDLDEKFVKKYKDILKLPRLGGYAIWKMQIIKQQLDKINEGDIIVYLDAGSTVNKKGKIRFYEYIKLLDSSDYGFLGFSNGRGRSYIIQELIDYFNKEKVVVNKKILDDKNYISGHIMIQKNEHSKLIINEFFKILEYNRFLITDKYNESNKKYDGFSGDSRHEQSILSLLFKIHGCVHNDDPHYFGDRDDALNNPKSKSYPFIATRQRKPTKKQIINKNKNNLLLILRNKN